VQAIGQHQLTQLVGNGPPYPVDSGPGTLDNGIGLLPATGVVTLKIQVIQNVLRANNAIAARNRERFEGLGLPVLNLISAPGSGKTALLERTLDALDAKRCAVLVGDLATTLDAERLGRHCPSVIQINTGKGCHLDAAQVDAGLRDLPVGQLDWLFIENVGNMVCPTEFDLGEHGKVALISTVEGEDKPVKYPTLFQKAVCVVLTKMDLAAASGFDRDRFYAELRRVNSDVPVIETSSRTGQGLDNWLAWLAQLRAAVVKSRG
jgi:hydrogenase nickel incorporation protein HypB